MKNLPLVKILIVLSVWICVLSMAYTVAAQKISLIVPTGHKGSIQSSEFSPDGKLALTHDDTEIKIWELGSAKLVRNISIGTNADQLKRSLFISDGKQFAAITAKGQMKMWDTKTGELLRENLFFEPVVSFEWSQHQDRLLIADYNSITLFEPRTGTVTSRLNTSKFGLLNGASFSSLGTYIIAWSGQYVAVIDVASGRLKQAIPAELKVTSRVVDINSIETKLLVGEGKELNIYDLTSGKLEINFQLPEIIVHCVFSRDEKNVICATENRILTWDTLSGQLTTHSTTEHDGSITLAPKGDMFGSFGYAIESLKFWKVGLAGKPHIPDPNFINVSSLSFDVDGKYCIAGSKYGALEVWEIPTWNQILRVEGAGRGRGFTGNFEYTGNVSLDGRSLLIAGKKASVIDINTGLEEYVQKSSGGIFTEFSTHGDYVAEFFENARQLKVWTTKAIGKPILFKDVDAFKFSNKGNLVAVISETDDNSRISVWDLSTRKVNSQYTGGFGDFLLDDKYLAIYHNGFKIYKTGSATEIIHVKGESEVIYRFAISPDSKRIATYGANSQVLKVWSIATGKLEKTFNAPNAPYYSASVEFSTDSKRLIVTNYDGEVLSWDVVSGEMASGCIASGNCILSADQQVAFSVYHSGYKIFSREGKVKNEHVFEGIPLARIPNTTKFLLQSGPTFTFYDLELNQKQLSITFIGESDWIVTHPSGLFDASPGAMDKVYFVQGLDIIDFNQLKERYYEPGLWKKVMAGEELRNVEAFTKIELPPDIELSEINAQGMLTIKAINRGGGIGKIPVLVNGKEVIEDVRPKGSNSDSLELTIQLPVIKFGAQFWPGDENFIAVKAWNAGHWVVSRGKIVTYRAPRKADIKPAIHVIACGISDYTGAELDLKFAAKDAEDVAQALTLGAKKLFGTEAAYVHSLTTSGSKETWPTKTNIVNTFKTISSTAKSTDVIVVYLAGHGITWGGQDGDFYYLTQDAYTGVTSAYNDPAIREKTTLSSAELIELFKLVPAQKQVMIIDACGSGKAVDNLIAKRDIPSSTLRALDRMKDRTGMHIITGCAADAVSYEASQFGQGILTYSLLEGIRGAALRDEKFVDVNQLFQYAQERVPVLVAGVGGIQTPQVFSPYGAQSFDIGEVSSEDKKKIPIAKVRPVFVRSSLINKNTLDDNLQLGKLLDEKLNDIAARVADAELIFVNVQEYPDGCKISGIYEQFSSTISADIKIKCGYKEHKQSITATSTEEFAKNIISITKN